MKMKQINKTEKVRNSNLELLRIISMILIILHHYSVHGGYATFTVNNLTVNAILIQMMAMFGRAACSVFALISGYFLITSQKGYKRNLSLLAALFFYSWLTLFVLFITGIMPVSLKNVIQSVFPIFWGSWYVEYYLIFSLFIPFLNPFLKNLSQKMYFKLLIIIFISWSIIPTFTHNAWSFSNFDFFVFMYITGAYIRLYTNDCTYQNKWNLWAALISAVLMLISVIIMDLLGKVTGIDMLVSNATYFREFSSPLAIIFAIGMFMFFKNINYHSPLINRIASSTLGIYLIHDGLIRTVIWEIIFPNNNYINSPWLLLHAILKCASVFIVCLIIDQARLLTIDKIFQKWINKHYPIWQQKYNKILDNLFAKR